jgi:WD repeat-containing protein 59
MSAVKLPAYTSSGHFVCFFRAPPRIVRNALQDLSVSPSKPTRTEEMPRMFQSPALLSDAVRLLSLAANDRTPTRQSKARDAKNAEENEHKILTIMTSLLSSSQLKPRRLSDTRPPLTSHYSLFGSRLLSHVYIRDISDITHLDRECATVYGFGIAALGENAAQARTYGRPDHERVFRTAEALLASSLKSTSTSKVLQAPAITILLKIYDDAMIKRDIQLLAILASLLLHEAPSTSMCASRPSGFMSYADVLSSQGRPNSTIPRAD